MPSTWSTHLFVDSASDSPFGRMAIIAAPQGEILGLLQPPETPMPVIATGRR
ncbi:hypothetical protein [Specibacter cremeus]|uniref:hypothetical protein n=1 Tax=Specibacter cremeus TaxID=1629051 RepID=UPI0013DE21D5|nr:hypothetical protein [Specibacter cremeus]